MGLSGIEDSARVGELRRQPTAGTDPATADGGLNTADPAVQTLREQFARGEISKEEDEDRLRVLDG